MNRTQNTKRNAIANLVSFVVLTLLNFFSRKVFLDFFPIEYFGLNALSTQILGMLSLVELGIGSAMIYSLYGPVADDNQPLIKSLMSLYKKFYTIIAIIVGVLGLLIMFFLKDIVKNEVPDHLLYTVFLLYLINTVVSYLIAYKRSLLFANQKAYIMTTIDTSIKLISIISQITVIYVFKRFDVFVGVSILFTIIGNIYVSYIVDKRYSFLRDKTVKLVEIPINKIKEIKKNVKALFLHKIGDFAIRGSDSIILSYFLSLQVVGIYSNFALLFSVVSVALSKLFDSATASIGNLIHSSDTESTYEIFRITHLINYIIVSNIVVGFYFLSNPFVSLWLGSKYLLDSETILLFTIYIFLTIIRYPLQSYKTAGGVFSQDKYLPLIQSAIFFISAIVLVPKYELSGLFIAHIISSLTIPSWSRGYFVFMLNLRLALL